MEKEMTAVEFIESEVKISDGVLTKGHLLLIIEQAKAMEKKQREKAFIEGYKNRALLSNLIFDAASELFAKSLFEQNKTFKSE